MRNGDILFEYFENLLNEILDSKHHIVDYSMMLRTMFDIPFVWVLEMDENRAEDGQTLRNDICRDNDLQYDFIINRKISVLEVLIALAKRMESDILGDPMSEIDNSSAHFWLMIKNLGLEKCSNGNFSEAILRDKIEKWMLRDIGKDGSGSIFPLKRPKNDQRKVEIWSQMQAYIMENY